jgi:MurNAc alpha-1-phosphate uridylyltransferase
MINQALIMAAGYGRRMQPFTNTKPKPLAEVNKKTLIAHIIEKLYNHQVENIVINTHYLSDLIIEHVKSLPLYRKLNILFSIENELLETGGGPVKATEYYMYIMIIIVISI